MSTKTLLRELRICFQKHSSVKKHYKFRKGRTSKNKPNSQETNERKRVGITNPANALPLTCGEKPILFQIMPPRSLRWFNANFPSLSLSHSLLSLSLTPCLSLSLPLYLLQLKGTLVLSTRVASTIYSTVKTLSFRLDVDEFKVRLAHLDLSFVLRHSA